MDHQGDLDSRGATDAALLVAKMVLMRQLQEMLVKVVVILIRAMKNRLENHVSRMEDGCVRVVVEFEMKVPNRDDEALAGKANCLLL